MNYKEAQLYKLAGIIKASSHVLRQRFLQKQAISGIPLASTLIGAGLGGGLGYFLNKDKESRLWTALGGVGLGGLAGYGIGKYVGGKPTEKGKKSDVVAKEPPRGEVPKELEGEKNVGVRSGLSGKAFDRLKTDATRSNRSSHRADTRSYKGVKPKYQYIVELGNVLENNPNVINTRNVSITSARVRNALAQIAIDASNGKYTDAQLNEILKPYYAATNGETTDRGITGPMSNIVAWADSSKPFSKSKGIHITGASISGVPIYPVEGVPTDGLAENRALGWVNRTRDRKWDGRTVGEENEYSHWFSPTEYKYHFTEQ